MFRKVGAPDFKKKKRGKKKEKIRFIQFDDSFNQCKTIFIRKRCTDTTIFSIACIRLLPSYIVDGY